MRVVPGSVQDPVDEYLIPALQQLLIVTFLLPLTALLLAISAVTVMATYLFPGWVNVGENGGSKLVKKPLFRGVNAGGYLLYFLHFKYVGFTHLTRFPAENTMQYITAYKVTNCVIRSKVVYGNKY